MKLQKKLYSVHIGLADDGEGTECTNWSKTNVVATNASEAISRARLKKGEYAEAVELVAVIDRP